MNSINPIIKEDVEYIYNKLSNKEKEFFLDSTILVTGAAGFLGFTFLNFLCQKSQDLKIKKIVALDNFMLRTPEWIENLSNLHDILLVKKFDIITDDLTEFTSERNLIVIHMASIASPFFYRKYPIETIDANIKGLRRLLDTFNNENLKGFLFFSSSEIYGDPDPSAVPTDEDYRGLVSCTGPRACYDESKRFGETICMLYAQQYNLPITVARPFNNYGPGMNIDDKRVPADFAKAVIEGNDIVILSDGSPMRTFCYVADAVCGYLKVLAHAKYNYFNIGIDSPEISVLQLANIYKNKINLLNGTNISIQYKKSDDKEYLTHNPQRRCPIIKKARNILGYNPEIDVETGVERFLKFLLNGGK